MKEFKDNSICFIDEFDSQKDIFLPNRNRLIYWGDQRLHLPYF